MTTSPEQQLATMIANIPEKTGKNLADWKTLLQKTGLTKHGQILKFLKTEYSVTHGFANLIASKFLEPEEEIDLVEHQYAGGKEDLKPIYELIIKTAENLGDDVSIAPKKSSVSLRRKKQFALITPASKTRIDLGLALKGEAPTERLETYNAMCSHRIRLESLDDVDGEVKKWLEEAYNRAG